MMYRIFVIVSRVLQNVQPVIKPVTALMVEHATSIMASRPAGNYVPLK